MKRARFVTSAFLINPKVNEEGLQKWEENVIKGTLKTFLLLGFKISLYLYNSSVTEFPSRRIDERTAYIIKTVSMVK